MVDDHGEGLPVAWAISNHENLSTLLVFLYAVKAQNGDINPTIFMSDDAEQFYTAWCTVFGGNTKKLLCAWHIDRSWRKSLNELVNDKQNRIEIYHCFRVLLLEQNIAKFHSCLQKFVIFA